MQSERLYREIGNENFQEPRKGEFRTCKSVTHVAIDREYLGHFGRETKQVRYSYGDL